MQSPVHVPPDCRLARATLPAFVAGAKMSGAVLNPGAKFKDELIATAKAITAPGKGILASDESTGTSPGGRSRDS